MSIVEILNAIHGNEEASIEVLAKGLKDLRDIQEDLDFLNRQKMTIEYPMECIKIDMGEKMYQKLLGLAQIKVDQE